MLYKEDWEQVKERMLAWWEGEIVDRVVLQVTAPRDGFEINHQWDWFYQARHLDQPEKALAEWEKYCQATYFGGESFPNLWINLGPGIPAAFLGAVPQIREDTIWFEPPGDLSWDEVLSLRLSEENKWWKTTKELTELTAQAGQGKYFAGMTDLNSVFNILCHLRGTQRVLTDLIDYPAEIKQACGLINEIWLTCFNELTGIIQRYHEGSSNWMTIWFPGLGGDVQCDFSAMISPSMFEEFVLGHLTDECRQLGHSIYHMDGPGQIPHLEILLEIPELGGIQWIPGAGNPPVGSPKWFPMYRRIQEKGKLLVLQGMDREDVEGVLRAIPSGGLLIETTCGSEQEARDLLRQAEKWTRD
ncbi:MAG TPA: hypothetical protein VM123_04090 [archaeon]|nr:hypothetical protein [archaeon]